MVRKEDEATAWINWYDKAAAAEDARRERKSAAIEVLNKCAEKMSEEECLSIGIAMVAAVRADGDPEQNWRKLRHRPYCSVVGIDWFAIADLLKEYRITKPLHKEEFMEIMEIMENSQ